ncbi:outer membrane protein [Aminobacter sp. MET-1]|uniref:outer membrane protein n=1 Tax=Aminobacter sp. MET-1 TaxID=2951085 RepID=UPI0022699075|nr:outer membrane protein [Aminobacter sp. MET-1]MCX8570893.1 porin family protein [Aminobacter sp. MET-1]
MKAILLASVLLGISAGQALAADATATAPAAFVWTGGYVGLQAGYAWGTSDAVLRNLGTPQSHFPLDPDGRLLGVYAGYNHQFSSSVVLGAEADLTYARIRSGTVELFDDASGGVIAGNTADADLKWTGAIRARAGYALDRFLPYVTAGVAFGRYEATPDYMSTPALPGSKTQTGWTIGAGVDHAVTDKIVARLDYRFVDLGHATYGITGFPSHDTRVDLKTHDFRLGVAYKF